MTQSVVNVGTLANDGTGNPLRTAFQNINTALTAVNVRSSGYGAVGDGVTNDTAAIQNAINDVSAAGGGKVICPAPYTYAIALAGTAGAQTYCLRLPSYVELVIERGATLKYTGTAGAIMVYALGGTNTAQISLSSNGVPAYPQTIVLSSVVGFVVGQDVEVGDSANFEINQITAINGATSTLTLENRLQFTYTTGASAFCQGYIFVDRPAVTGGGTIDGQFLSHHGVQFFDTKVGAVIGMKIKSTSTDNATYYGRGVLLSGLCHRAIVAENDIEDIADRGIEDYVYTSLCTIRDNVLKGVAIHGIARHGRDQHVHGNRVVGSGSTSSHANIHIDTAQYCRIADNTCIASQGNGIQIDGGVDGNVQIVNNLCEGNANYGLYLNGATTVSVEGNRVVANGSIGLYITSTSIVNLVGNSSRSNLNDGLRINTGDQFTIVGNDFTGNTGYGIRFSTTPNKTRCIGNDVSGNSVGGILGSCVGWTYGNTVTTGAGQGSAVLVGGTVTVNTAEVLATDGFRLTRTLTGGTVGHLTIGTIVAGTSFVINASVGTDTSTVFWEIVH